MTIATRTVDGVEVTAYHFKPAENDWRKFLAFARKAAPPDLISRIKSVLVYALDTEHGRLFNIRYTALMEASKLVPEKEIMETDNDNRT